MTDNLQQDLNLGEETMEETPKSIEENNISKILEVVDKCLKEGKPALIDEQYHMSGNRTYRFFYDLAQDSFIIGPNAKIEGFEMPDGEVLRITAEDEEVTSRSYLDNIIVLNRNMFDDEHSWSGYAQNLWLSCKLFALMSDDLDPSYATYLSIVKLVLDEDQDDVVDFLTYKDVKVQVEGDYHVVIKDAVVRYDRVNDILSGVVDGEVVIEQQLATKKAYEGFGKDGIVSSIGPVLGVIESAIVAHYQELEQNADDVAEETEE